MHGVPGQDQLRYGLRDNPGGSGTNGDGYRLRHDLGRYDRKHSMQPYDASEYRVEAVSGQRPGSNRPKPDGLIRTRSPWRRGAPGKRRPSRLGRPRLGGLRNQAVLRLRRPPEIPARLIHELKRFAQTGPRKTLNPQQFACSLRSCVTSAAQDWRSGPYVVLRVVSESPETVPEECGLVPRPTSVNPTAHGPERRAGPVRVRCTESGLPGISNRMKGPVSLPGACPFAWTPGPSAPVGP